MLGTGRNDVYWGGLYPVDCDKLMMVEFFTTGTAFRIIFEIKDTDVITIYCQGKFHSNFLPKIPLSMARYVVAWADVEKVTHCYFHLGTKVGVLSHILLTHVTLGHIDV